MSRPRAKATTLHKTREEEIDSLPASEALIRGSEEEESPVLSDFYEDDDPDLDAVNDPDMDELEPPPLLGGRARPTDIFGSSAETTGRATAPKLWGTASKFPTAAQFRVWRWENGVPVALGVIDAQADEDDFIKLFEAAMPQPGSGRIQYKLRPIDLRGQELGKEMTITISEHHATLKMIREQKRREEEERRMGYPGGWGNRPQGDVIVQGGDGAATQAYEEMGRMFESAVDSAERQRDLLQQTLEAERERLRVEERERTAERVSMAERATGAVEKMSERLLQADRTRSDEAMRSQKQHTDTLLATLTTVFQQQQEAARLQSERMREADLSRMEQDRAYYERHRIESEAKRQAERDEWERRREQDAREWAQKQDVERQRLEADRARIESERKYDIERMRLEVEERKAKDQQEADRRRIIEQEERDRREALETARWQRERDEFARLEERRREEARQAEERRREDAARETQALLRAEELRREEIRAAEERRRLESVKEREELIRLEDRRRDEMRKDEERRREDAQREREALNRLDEQRRAEAREADERRREENRLAEERRRDEAARDAERRKEETLLQMKQLDMQATKDREHSERMMEMARLEREAQREAQLQREKTEREAREFTEKERQRQHDIALREIELSKERDREHQERMMALAKAQQAGGIGGLTDLIGMQPGEILARIFGATGRGDDDDEEGGSKSWPEMITEGLQGLGEIAKAFQARNGALPGPRNVPRLPGGAQPIPMTGPAQAPRPHQPQPQPPQPPQPQPQESKPESPVPEVRPINTSKLAKEAGMAVLQQKKAREALRRLAKKLADSDEESWPAHVRAAVMGEPLIYAYITAVSVMGALSEATDDEDLVERIMSALREAGADLPFTEADIGKGASIEPESEEASVEAPPEVATEPPEPEPKTEPSPGPKKRGRPPKVKPPEEGA